VADALRQDGFQTVMLMTDLTRDALQDALRTFRGVAANADWAVVYYAGHGREAGGKGYLVPVEARLEDEQGVAGETVLYGDLEAAVAGARALRIIIVDADPPFHVPGPASEPKAGTLTVFSTRPDGVGQSDGTPADKPGDDGGISPFAKALATHLREPGLEIRRLFDYVRDDVMTATGDRQAPFAYGALPGRKEFFFVVRK
jgi:uncharacterized caspase-like protein